MHLHLEIHKDGNRYFGLLRRPDRNPVQRLGELALGPEAKVRIKDREHPLEKLIRALILRRREDMAQAFDERGQRMIGTYLFGQTLAKAFPEPPEGEVILHLDTEAEEIARLPWVLLADKNGFLVARGWSVVVSTGTREPRDCLLPATPRLLVAMPQPRGTGATQAAEHLAELEALLRQSEPTLALDGQMRLVETWEAFAAALEEFAPQVIYYYGHGQAQAVDASTRLLFASGRPGGPPDPRPVADVADLLKAMPEPPVLVYVNCCQGDAGGLLGVGRQLETEVGVPAVITNRTVADIPAARAQALQLWEELLLRGEPPHRAVGGLYRGMSQLGLSHADVRWMTPVLHGHYREWRTGRRGADRGPEGDSHWRLKIDRVAQFSVVDSQTRLMLKTQRPRCRAFVWYGREGDGVELFHNRLEVELRESLRDTATAFLPVAPEWPQELGDPYLSFRAPILDAFKQEFQVESLEEIPYALRAKSQGYRQTLVYLRHPPVKGTRLINPHSLKAYLGWWEDYLLPLLEPDQFVLSTVSFVTDEPGTFQNTMEDEAPEEDLVHTELLLLDALDRLTRSHLRTFLRTHDVGFPDRLPNRLLNQVLDRILERTGGLYEQTAAELADLSPWVERLAAEKRPENRQQYDY